MKKPISRCNPTYRRKRTASCHRRRGAMLVMVAICMIILLFMTAISIDVAYMQLTRTELRAATDAAARAAAGTLSREQSPQMARRAARQIAATNEVAGEPLLLDDSDIRFGNSTMTLAGVQQFRPGANPLNAAQVTGRRTDDSGSGPVPLFLGGMFGVNRFQPQQSAVAARLDRDLCLVLDHSGSMRRDNRWSGLVTAVDVFLSELDNTPQDEKVALVGYSSQASIVHELTDDLDSIRTAFSRLSPSGRTAIGAGLELGSDALVDNGESRPFASKTIIVMTDGQHNTGTSPDVTVQVAQDRGHTVHTITFSADANQSLMRRVAQLGGGIHLHAPDNEALKDAFKEIALTLPVVLTE